MSKIGFIVEGKRFFVDGSIFNADEFQVYSLPRPYSVSIEKRQDPIETINSRLKKHPQSLLLIDENILKSYGNKINIKESKMFSAVATEKFKTINGVLKIVDFLNDNKFTKGERLIVVGGGIIEDVGAFVGACYKRGIYWEYIPTTLLSMCDSCIGGKTGINHGNAKNQLALFSAPGEVIINPNFLKTLSAEAIISGIGEILKLVITGGNESIEIYKKNIDSGKAVNFAAYKQLILTALSVKKSIIEFDEFEKNHRKSLNYGHTLGHVVETLSNYTIPHGQSVIIGVLIANELSLNRRLLKEKECSLLRQISLELLSDKVRKKVRSLEIRTMNDLLQKDKKVIGNKINFVMIKSIGNTIFVPIEIDQGFVDEVAEIIRVVF